MKLLLHVGTHKTATTSIQHFCTLHRSALRQHGYFYPSNPVSAYVTNFLASQIAHGRERETAAFLARARRDAAKAGCHTVVISAESFYAMTTFFVDIPGRSRGDYWENERRLIDTVRACCDGFDVTVCAYLRPQDEFASSLYNQLVKNVVGIDHSYEAFVEAMRPAFDYDRHFTAWETTFGAERVRLRNFGTHRDRILEDFCATFLGGSCMGEAARSGLFSNTRLSRDVLETKRIFNRTAPDRSLAFVAARCFAAVSEQMPDQPGYQVFASVERRRRDFAGCETGNANLAARHGMAPLPTVGDATEPTYPGFTLDRAVEVYLRFRMAMDRPAVRTELALRRLANRVRERVPGGKRFMQPLQRANNYIRLRLSRF